MHPFIKKKYTLLKYFRSYKAALALIILIAIFSNSCKSLDKLTQFNLEFTDTITIPSVLGINLPFNIITPAIKTNSSDIFEVNETRKDLIEEINLTSLKLSIISPQTADFDFLKSIEIYIETNNSPEILIAWIDNIENTGAQTIELEISSEDLTKYITEDEIQLKTTAVTDKIPLTDLDVKIDATFFVNAKILGI